MTKQLLLLLVLLLMPTLAAAQSYTLTPLPYYTGFDNNGVIINGGCLWTYSAGTTTQVATYSNTSGTQNANPVILDSAGRATVYLLAGQSYKFVLENIPCSASSHGTVLRTQDNIAAVPASSSNLQVLGTAGAAFTAGELVYLSDGSGGNTSGQWFAADSTNTYSSTTPILGFSPNAITSGAVGTIQLAGEVTGLSALSVGSSYFVSTAGTITSTAPANRRYVGVADSTSSIVMIEGEASGALGSGTPGATTFLRGDYQWINVACGGILLKQNSGSTTATGAADLDTYALSGLTAKDVLVIAVSQSQAAQTQAGPVVVNQNTDTKLMADLAATPAAATGNALAAGKFARDYWEFNADPSAATKVYGLGTSTGNISFDGGQALGGTFQNAVTWTTAFTGSVTIALHTPGQTNGGTTSWEWWICKRPGQ